MLALHERPLKIMNFDTYLNLFEGNNVKNDKANLPQFVRLISCFVDHCLFATRQ